MLDVLPTSLTDSCPDACLIEYNTQHVLFLCLRCTALLFVLVARCPLPATKVFDVFVRVINMSPSD